MKKITVIGRGTVGCLAVAHFLRWTNWEIDWVFDPNINPSPVGEGTTLRLPNSLYTNLDFNLIDMNNINANVKLGIRKRGWGKGKDFYHTFPMGSYGIHFSAVYFQDYVFNKLSKNRRIKTIETNVEKYDAIDSDFIMVCTGTPKTFDNNFYIHKNIPVNSAIVFQCPWDYPRFDYSLTFAKKHGWVFGIPIKNRCAIGYIFNSSFSTDEEIKNDVSDIFDEFNLTPESFRKINFENYSRIENFSERICYNGNASFFLEPLEATSTGFADKTIRWAFDVWNGNMNFSKANLLYRKEIDEIESMICLHYFCGSIFESHFWNYAKKLTEEKIHFDFENKKEFANIIKKSLYRSNFYENYKNSEGGAEVGAWPASSYLQNIEGMETKEIFHNLITKYNV